METNVLAALPYRPRLLLVGMQIRPLSKIEQLAEPRIILEEKGDHVT
jgi:hypothetical protein